MANKCEVLQGTLDMLVLRVLSRGELHGWGITQKLEQLSQRAYRRCLALAQREALQLLSIVGTVPARMTPLPNAWLPRMLELPDLLFRRKPSPSRRARRNCCRTIPRAATCAPRPAQSRA